MSCSSRQSRDGLSFLSAPTAGRLRCLWSVAGVNTRLRSEKEFPKKANPAPVSALAPRKMSPWTGNCPPSPIPGARVPASHVSQICKLGGGSHNLSRLNCPLSHFSSPSAVILLSHKMSSLSNSNFPDCCVMILSCETVKCPVNL